MTPSTAQSPAGPLELSIVVPFLNEEATLELLLERLKGLEGLPEHHEIILVSDGSTDGSVQIAERWAHENSRIKLMVLTRNFGHQAAIGAGLDWAHGKFIGIMDADLQDSPEVLIEMYEVASSENWDVVFGTRRHRAGSWLKRAAYHIFYSAYASMAETPVDLDSGDFCVLSRRAVDILTTLPERIRFMRGLRSWTGLRAKPFPTDRPERAAGKPQYSWTKLFSLALHGITSFSAMPLRVATLIGILLCGASLLLVLFYLIAMLTYHLHSKVPGFTTVVVLILFLSGAQFLMMGIIGEYIAQIFWEVKHRPAYLVDRTVNLTKKSDE